MPMGNGQVGNVEYKETSYVSMKLGALLVLILCTSAVLACGGGGGSNGTPTDTSNNDTSTADTTSALFTAHIFELDKIDRIYPLGNLNGGYDESTGLTVPLAWIKSSVISEGGKVAIYAPTDMDMQYYAYYQFDTDPAEWALTFTINSNLTLRLDHVSEVTQEIMDGTTSTPVESSAGLPPTTALSFTAGELLGYTTGTYQANNWNVMLYDSAHTNIFVNQERYEVDSVGEFLRTAVCPWDQYDDEMKAEYYAKLGIDSAGEVSNCGTVSQDMEETLSGQWHFDSDTSTGITVARDGVYDSPFAIYNNDVGTIQIHQINATRYEIETTNSSYMDPASVTTSHCYELASTFDSSDAGHLYLSIVSSTEMRMYHASSGACPSSFPTTGYKTYYR